jgi:hypothetical protein
MDSTSAEALRGRRGAGGCEPRLRAPSGMRRRRRVARVARGRRDGCGEAAAWLGPPGLARRLSETGRRDECHPSIPVLVAKRIDEQSALQPSVQREPKATATGRELAPRRVGDTRFRACAGPGAVRTGQPGASAPSGDRARELPRQQARLGTNQGPDTRRKARPTLVGQARLIWQRVRRLS